jgi:hypothetical protein
MTLSSTNIMSINSDDKRLNRTRNNKQRAALWEVIGRGEECQGCAYMFHEHIHSGFEALVSDDQDAAEKDDHPHAHRACNEHPHKNGGAAHAVRWHLEHVEASRESTVATTH